MHARAIEHHKQKLGFGSQKITLFAFCQLLVHTKKIFVNVFFFFRLRWAFCLEQLEIITLVALCDCFIPMLKISSVLFLSCNACASEDCGRTLQSQHERCSVFAVPAILDLCTLPMPCWVAPFGDFFSLLEVFGCWPVVPIFWRCLKSLVSSSSVNIVHIQELHLFK